MGTRMAPNYDIIFMHAVEQEILNKAKLKLRKLAHWGYPKDLLINSFLKANKQNREDILISERIPSLDIRISLITMYNRCNPPMKDILQRHRNFFTQTRK